MRRPAYVAAGTAWPVRAGGQGPAEALRTACGRASRHAGQFWNEDHYVGPRVPVAYTAVSTCDADRPRWPAIGTSAIEARSPASAMPRDDACLSACALHDHRAKGVEHRRQRRTGYRATGGVRQPRLATAGRCRRRIARSVPAENTRLYTVGHGARPVEALLAVLGATGVDLVVDIRRFPGSRRHPQFGRERLADALAAAGIGYDWQGDALGGRRPRSDRSRHIALREAGFAGYADHMGGPQFRAAVDVLIDRAARRRLAVMCAETVWWHCHRMLVADAAVLRGTGVVHLIEVGRSQPHRLSPTVRRGDDGWPVYD